MVFGDTLSVPSVLPF
uniref:Uncharacterized protein n=1 Tax=Anopheles quadriannulatus TaxID=34691 RepID=A0A182XS89_ANOQN